MDSADVVGTASHLLGQGSSDRARAKRVAGRPRVRGERHRREELGQTKRARQHSGFRTHHGRNANPVNWRIQLSAENLRPRAGRSLLCANRRYARSTRKRQDRTVTLEVAGRQPCARCAQAGRVTPVRRFHRFLRRGASESLILAPEMVTSLVHEESRGGVFRCGKRWLQWWLPAVPSSHSRHLRRPLPSLTR